jgi:hypothetical protein
MLMIIFIGIMSITISLTTNINNDKKCPKEKIIYKYIPRTFEEDQDEPVYVSDIFQTMFTQDSPWVRSINSIDSRQQESINNFFISQY